MATFSPPATPAYRAITYEEWQRYLPDGPYPRTSDGLPIHPSAVDAAEAVEP